MDTAEECVSYRGRACWADWRHALHLAEQAGRMPGHHYLVKGVNVPGRGWHWIVKRIERRSGESEQRSAAALA
jgi:hypothetical protein